ncbi:methylisocitrate lyase [Candidatus Halocynthiibacter alkanivorans]|uniref:methylisocitrate lyase n=1 Tax=Candidatus Halocynthiibacter alkanivorans TaxID=2267619 RepID=UPI000DF1FA66|nr:methylisocitrate lyase [Candidatus Halocynthiibacter alkanivorans]
MLFSKLNGPEKRAKLRDLLKQKTIIRAPGAFSPLVAMEIERTGFEAVYVSGAVLSADLGLPDIGLTTLTEVADRAEQIARVTDLPTIVDCDTGFGEPMSVARTVRMMEDRGIAGFHLEDQVNPKRCGHLDGKTVVSTEDMVRRIKAAADARRDPNMVIIARSDARMIEGLDAMIARANAYAEAGADMIFTEALLTAEDWRKASAEIAAPLLANMTEFGKSDLLSAGELQDLGASMVIYPVTSLRIAMKAVSDALGDIEASGTQREIIGKMQTRQELYDLLQYERYNTFDQGLFNFKL